MKISFNRLKHNTLFGIIIGGVVFGGIGVGATTYLYNSNQVSYYNTDSNVTDIKGALDELYTLSNQKSPISFILLDTQRFTNTQSYTYDVSSYKGYENFTTDNFWYRCVNYATVSGSTIIKRGAMSILYDNTTGIVTFTQTLLSGDNMINDSVSMYLLYT